MENYDSFLFPAPRSQFLKCWIHQPKCTAFGIMTEQKLTGYGVIRAARQGFKIGPLFADDEMRAEQLFQALIGQVPQGDPIFLDTPEVNSAAISLAKRHNMKKVFETARMYTKNEPTTLLNRCFGITSLELG